MKITGIISEYNPFHNGHAYQIKKIKESAPDTFTVALMSGNFVQRGEPAVFDKFTRAEMALKGGADIVIELPVCFSLQGADGFASGAVTILDSLNAIDTLCFGSECGDINQLTKTAAVLAEKKDLFGKLIKEELKKGLSFGEAKLTAAKLLFSGAEILTYPNNLLAVEYISSLSRINSRIIPETIKREGADHNEKIISGLFASASAIRNAIACKDMQDAEKCIPDEIKSLFVKAVNGTAVNHESFYPITAYILRSCGTKKTAEIQGVSEGFENKLLTAAFETSTFNELMARLVTRRYTKTRVQRILCSVLLNITKQDIEYAKDKKNLYARVLGFSKNAEKALSKICGNSSIPIISKAADIDEENPVMKKDILASELYFLASRQSGRRDYKNKLLVI